MKRVCVFAGSSVGGRPAYAEAAQRLAEALVGRGLGIVYGGGSVGLMGVLADAALAAGGEVIGVIPGPLASRELAHAGLTRMHVVPSMHERKALMASLVDGFIALPGGLGTFEETLEILTWSHLGIHRKPIGVLNVEGYFDGLRRFLDHAVAEGFVRRDSVGLLRFVDAPAALLDAMASWRPPDLPRVWLNVTQT
ncbi:MAG: TIGR00730 family Rossman fold protein [Candidatus Rokuibacteriota bacterium]|nr:MAG: TIGR00730 family Rossman fold protein [Candidatus Rokubacteria bacterium]